MKNRKPLSLSGILEKTRISKLSSIVDRAPEFERVAFPTMPISHKCSGCNGIVEKGNEFLQAVKVCRRCLVLHEKINEAFLAYTNEKAKNFLEKFDGGSF